MTEFHFVSVWKIEAPLAEVWDTLLRFEDWPRWWKGVEQVTVLEWGAENRVGFQSRQIWKSELPYRLTFEGTITGVEPMSKITLNSHGELLGEGTMRFGVEGGVTIFQYDWNVSTTKPWMNLVAPVATPFFDWNHKVIMDWGAESLAAKLDAKLISTAETSYF